MSCTSSYGSTVNGITTPSDTPKQQTGSSRGVIRCLAVAVLQALPSATEKLLYATLSSGNMPAPLPSCVVVPPMMLLVIMSCSSLLFIRVRDEFTLHRSTRAYIQFPVGLEAEGLYFNGVARAQTD